MSTYTVFTRTWWREINGKLTPYAGRRTTLCYGLTYTEARQLCEKWNMAHKPGKLSRRAEFTKELP